MNKKIVLNTSEVVTCSGFEPKFGTNMSNINIIKNGAVVIEDNFIKAVDDEKEILKKYNKDEYIIIDANKNSVIPGFVDSHTHFVFGGYREEEFSWRLRGDSYMDIMNRGGGIASTVKSTKKSSLEELIKSGNKRLNSMLEFGVTTVEGKSGYGLDIETEIKQLNAMRRINKYHPIDIVTTFLGPHAVPKKYKGRESEFIDFQIDEVLPIVVENNLAEFADIFCEKGVFEIKDSRKFLLAAKKMGLKLKIHADEIVQLGGAELAAELKAVSADHLLAVSEKGIEDMIESKVISTLLPTTAFSLKEQYANGRQMIDKGCAVALATDLNPGSSFTNSIPLLISLAAIYMNLSPEEILTALTINGASALDREKEIGSIDVGKKADMLILDYPSYKFLPYHIGINIVRTVIKNGKIVKLN